MREEGRACVRSSGADRGQPAAEPVSLFAAVRARARTAPPEALARLRRDAVPFPSRRKPIAGALLGAVVRTSAPQWANRFAPRAPPWRCGGGQPSSVSSDPRTESAAARLVTSRARAHGAASLRSRCPPAAGRGGFRPAFGAFSCQRPRGALSAPVSGRGKTFGAASHRPCDRQSLPAGFNPVGRLCKAAQLGHPRCPAGSGPRLPVCPYSASGR